MIPAHSRSTLTLADGAILRAISSTCRSAVPRSPPIALEIGTPLAVGACVGRIVRVFAGGFAVHFVEVQNQYDLNRLLLRSVPLSSAGGAKAVSELDATDVEPADA